MKKVAKSKNKGKISELLPIMQEQFGNSMNLARIKLMVVLLEALVKAQTAGWCDGHGGGQGVEHATSAKVSCKPYAGL